MSSLTPRLQLKSPDGTDPFLRTDYVATLALLDDAAGVKAGPSGGPPSWNINQTDRLYLESDTGRLIRWTGTAWTEILQSPEGFSSIQTTPGIGTPAAGANGTYAFPSLTMKRPGILTGHMDVQFSCPQNANVGFTFRAYIDTSPVSLRDIPFYRYTPAATTSTDVFSVTVPFRSAPLAAGVHTPKIWIAHTTGAYAGTITGATFIAVSTV